MDTKTIIPIPDAPLVTGNRITEVWFRFLLQLFNRTGGAPGVDVTKIVRDINDLQASVESENYGAAIAALQAALADVPPDVLTTALIEVTAAQVADLQAQLEALVIAVTTPGTEPPVDSIAYLSAAETPAPDVAVFAVREEPPSDVFSHGSLAGGDLHAVASQSEAGFMSAADKLKLDTLPSIVMSPIALTADVVAQNSTADVNIFSTTLAANSLAVGSTFLSSFTMLASAAGSSGTLSIWVKVGATKVLTATFTVPLVGLSNQAIVSVFRFTVRTTGAGGTFQVSGNNNGNSTLFTSGIVINTASGSINTTTSNTLSIGMNWSVANVANVATAKTGLMNQEK